MTQRATIQCVHEPFGDAWYYGPERLASRFMDDPEGRLDSGFSRSTYRTIMDRLEREGSQVWSFSSRSKSSPSFSRKGHFYLKIFQERNLLVVPNYAPLDASPLV